MRRKSDLSLLSSLEEMQKGGLWDGRYFVWLGGLALCQQRKDRVLQPTFEWSFSQTNLEKG